MPTPNIILILTDHFRRDALGPHTPNLMKLAARGVRFTNAYCGSPLCQPSRVSIITGQYPSQHNICGNQSEPIADQLRDDTFMHRLKSTGYHTALIGKHHYIDRYGVGMYVTEDNDELRRYGFDDVIQVVDDGENGHNDDEYTRYLASKDMLEPFRRALKGPNRGFRHPFAEDDSADGFIGSNGVRFIKEYASENPFYLNLSFVGPHPPLWHPGELTVEPGRMPAPVGTEDNKRTRERRAHYTEKCALIDRYVGRLVTALEQRGQLDNTMILFTSDHGDMLGDFGVWDKRHFYEPSVGVPLFMCGPGVPCEERLNGPRVSKALASHLDIYPTILRMAGVDLPEQARRDGRDLIEMATGTPGSGRDAIHAELGTCAMIRTANWKLVFDPEGGGVLQLFNLAGDPNEERNLAGDPAHDRVSKELLERMLAHRIRLTQFTHIKEETRLQRVRIA